MEDKIEQLAKSLKETGVASTEMEAKNMAQSILSGTSKGEQRSSEEFSRETGSDNTDQQNEEYVGLDEVIDTDQLTAELEGDLQKENQVEHMQEEAEHIKSEIDELKQHPDHDKVQEVKSELDHLNEEVEEVTGDDND